MSASTGYLPLPVLVLLASAIGTVMMVRRRGRKDVKVGGPWISGRASPAQLPIGEPAAQSSGQGFVPAFQVRPLPHLFRKPRILSLGSFSAIVGMWTLIGAFAVLLLLLASTG